MKNFITTTTTITALIITGLFASVVHSKTTQELTSKAEVKLESKTEIQIKNPWVRFLPGKMSTGAFMDIENKTNKEKILIGASSNVAHVVELHDHIHINGVMKMTKIESIKIHPEKTTTLKPGGLHVMLINLKEPLKEHSKIKINLEFADGTKEAVEAEVKDLR